MSRNNSYSVKGFLHEVLPAREVQGEKKFKVQEFVVKTQEEYPQLLKFEIYDDKTSQIGSIPNGQAVDVSFSQRGREYQGKIYNSNRAWKVEPVAGGLASAAPAAKAKTAPAANAARPAPARQSPSAAEAVDGEEKPF